MYISFLWFHVMKMPNLLTLATLSDATQIEIILYVSNP
jgi:hypothetical protein